jgi:trimethylguanosine synthase
VAPSSMRFVVSEGIRSLLRGRVSAVRAHTHHLPFIYLDSHNHIHKKKLVIALDTSPTRLSLARHNAQIYGVADRIDFILADYISFATAYASSPHPSRKIDVVFLSPPWGGISYLSGTKIFPPSDSDQNPYASKTDPSESEEPDPTYPLASIRPVHGAELYRLARKITRNIAYYLPRNMRLEDLSNLLIESDSGENVGREENKGVQKKLEEEEEVEMVEVEEEWMGSKLKALTCYFGGLAAGQEALFDV